MTPSSLKKKSISKLKKEAWTEFSIFIRNRDNFICFTCGKDMRGSRALHAGHFISRRHNATMFDERNVNAQCMYCNMWDYGNMGSYSVQLVKKYGDGILDELHKKSRQIKQFKAQELIDLKNHYRAINKKNDLTFFND